MPSFARPQRVWVRLPVFVLGLAVVLFSVWGLAWVALGVAISGQLPDPDAPNGDPCCGTPDDWGEVASGLAATSVVAVVDVLILCAGIVLLLWAGTKARSLRWRHVLRLQAASLVLLAVASGVTLAAQTPKRKLTDCSSFAFRPADWRSIDPGVHLRAAYGIQDCDLTYGLTATQVARKLGEPDSREVHERATKYHWERWSYPDLVVTFEGREIVDADAGPPGEAGDEED